MVGAQKKGKDEKRINLFSEDMALGDLALVNAFDAQHHKDTGPILQVGPHTWFAISICTRCHLRKSGGGLSGCRSSCSSGCG